VEVEFERFVELGDEHHQFPVLLDHLLQCVSVHEQPGSSPGAAKKLPIARADHLVFR
jgi:hypothetical protein